MIARVHRRTGDLELRRTGVRLGGLVRATLAALEPQLEGVRLRLELPAREWQAEVDAAQLGEALSNVVSNAADAMRGRGGTLTVKLSEGRRELVVEVADTGPGMTRSQRAHALEPFYTTKGGGTNFGLGLPYAYQVMRKHGGTLTVRSRIGQGTTVYMALPKRSVRAEPVASSRAADKREAGLDAGH
ncbi:sensor histidine kinase [Cohnella rhizoplanae]|uniref:sensor histidine kinase n=1 Tax=Cohnella rhizoplanae TaxID=2974897 RepID=UPI003D7C35A2